MNFQDYFTQSSVIPELTSGTKIEAIHELIAILKRYRRIPDEEAVADRVIERETLDSTGIGHGVAIPHARIPTLNRIVCGLARHPTGLDFDSIDHQPVRLIILILYPPSEAAPYLFLVSALTRMLVRDGVAGQLLEVPEDALLTTLITAADAYTDNTDLDNRAATDTASSILPPTSLQPEVSQLIRLQRLEDQRPARGRVNATLEEKVSHVRSCIPDLLVQHYDKLRKRGGLAIVASEAGICQGCHMQFPTSFAQELRSTSRIPKCPSCSRFLYVLS